MPKIRPPRKEPAAVTIGNLELHARNMTARIVDLVKARDENYDSAKQWREQAYKAQAERDELRQANDHLRQACDYNSGYIARVKETDNHMFGEPLNGNAPR